QVGERDDRESDQKGTVRNRLLQIDRGQPVLRARTFAAAQPKESGHQIRRALPHAQKAREHRAPEPEEKDPASPWAEDQSQLIGKLSGEPDTRAVELNA